MTLIVFSVIYAGQAFLAMSMRKHYEKLWGKRPPHLHQFFLRSFGWITLGASFWMSLSLWEKGIGAIIWFGLFTVAGFLFTILFSYTPRRAYYAIPVASLLGAIGAIV